LFDYGDQNAVDIRFSDLIVWHWWRVRNLIC
jgi:hypothetical protein